MFNSNYDRWKLTEPESEIIGYDWKEREIYADVDQEYYRTPSGFVLNDRDEIEEYMKETYSVIAANELTGA